jgi:3-deoxy-7-phosphoheptulonate synthase
MERRLNSYYGDSINGIEFSEEKENPNPARLLSIFTVCFNLNLLRSFAQGGFANLRKVNSWNMGFVKASKEGKKYEEIAGKINEYLDFMDAVGVNTSTVIDLNTVDFYTSHEGLHLPYEASINQQLIHFQMKFIVLQHILYGLEIELVLSIVHM